MRNTPIELNVLSYNIHKGFDSGSRRFVLSKIKEAIQNSGADLVFLQEVSGHHEEERSRIANWPNNAQFEYLADQIWTHYAYGKNASFIDRHHGNAILSKFPFVLWENIDVTTNRLEPRGILHGVLDLQCGKSVHAICVHFDLFEKGRTKQIRKLCQRVSEHVPVEAPLILCGDFNDWRERATQILEDELGLKEAFKETAGEHARTFPVIFPFLCLDRIYFRGLFINSASRFTDRSWRSLSDHVAIAAQLTLP